MNFSEYCSLEKIAFTLVRQLNPAFTYHNIHHTIDVVQQVERIGHEEKVSDEELFLLKVAALFHDTGFLVKYKNHEEESSKIFLKEAEAFTFSEDEKDLMTGLIMATKVPQGANNLLQQIICDADLDYLGREDFAEGSQALRQEYFNFNLVSSEEEWEHLQIQFLKSHQYFTRSSQELRGKVKERNMLQLERVSD